MTEAQKTAQKNRLEKLIGCNDIGELLEQLLDDAEALAKAYMHRTVIPEELIPSIGDAALVAYNRLGTEGESGRSEAGESYRFIELPDKFYRLWRSYRLARVSSNAYEEKPDANNAP